MAINEHFVPKRKMTSTMQNGQIGFRNHNLFKSLRSLNRAYIDPNRNLEKEIEQLERLENKKN